MPALKETEQVGKREELADFVTNIQSKATPYSTMIKKGKKPNQTLIQFQMKAYPEVAHGGVMDGKDVENFNHVARKMAQALPQKMRWNPAVTDFAEESNVAGESSTEMARQKIDGLIIIKRMIEQRLLSNADFKQENGVDVPYETRGILQWFSSVAQSLYPVDADFRTPATSRHTGTLAALTEEAFGDLMQSSYEQHKGSVNLKGIVGIALKRRITKYSTYSDDVASTTQARIFNQEAKSKAIINTIDKLVMDTGTVDLIPSSFLATDAATGAKTDYSTRSGVFFDPAQMELVYTRMPRIKDLEDRGGGPRATIDAIIAHICKNPLGGVVVYTNSDS